MTTEDGGFELVELSDPSPGPHEVVIRVAACGVCGSDVKARPFLPSGTVMGHEFGGEVVAVGAAASKGGWREGIVVAVLPVVSCGQCVSCERGDVAHCRDTRFVGMGTDGGGFAELAIVPARHAFAFPSELPAPYAALVEPFAVGLHGVTKAEVGEGDRVLVIGAGGVGLTTVAWASARRAGQVTAVDPDPNRRTAAMAMGAHEVLASVEDAPTDFYDAVIECVGRPELVTAGADAARAGGRVVVSGACEQPVTLEPISALLKELSFRFSVCYRPAEFRSVIDGFASGVIDPTRMAGPSMGLDRVAEAFELVRSAGADRRVLIEPGMATA